MRLGGQVMKGLKVIGRILSLILREWETSRVFSCETGVEKAKTDAAESGGRSWDWSLGDGQRGNSVSQQASVLVLVSGSCPLRELVASLAQSSLWSGICSFNDQRYWLRTSTVLGTGPHIAATEIDCDPVHVDGDRWVRVQVDKTFNLSAVRKIKQNKMENRLDGQEWGTGWLKC